MNFQGVLPPKTKMEPKNGGLEDDPFLFSCQVHFPRSHCNRILFRVFGGGVNLHLIFPVR